MTVLRHDYQSPDDFTLMQSLTQRTWSSRSRWHVGDVAWGRHATPGAAAGWRTALWADADDVYAWGWVELPGELGLLVDPATPHLVGEVIRWFEEVTAGADRVCVVLDTEAHLIDGLVAMGYRVSLDGPFFRFHAMSLDDLAEPVVPAGFRLRHVEPDEAQLRADVHRTSWSEFGTRMTPASWAAVMSAWPYRHELDWIVETPSGVPVASALGWLDDVNHAGLLEPVGCAPPYRRMGLARAANLACLHAMRSHGARTGHVDPRGDDGYPVPGQLYRSIGFTPGPRTVTYVKSGQQHGR